MEKIFQLLWKVPFGALSFKLDSLSFLFLIAAAILFISAGIYGFGYMRQYKGKKPLGPHVFFYLILALAVTFIVTANNVILFLSAWELMTISTFFLIIFQEEKSSVRKAGFIYMITSHCATFCLFLMFFLMSQNARSMSFDVIAKTSFVPGLAAAVFILAILGFGVKAGFIPLHIWLPHAHPAAPAHVSSILSGITIKTGIYGICRILWILGVLPPWCGYTFLVIGVISGVMGVLFALGQHELKKLLAYHSIENIGIIALGLGVGLLGRSYNNNFLAILGFGGGLLHVLNHALFKGLLFLGAGSVISKTHSGEMDQLGGLVKTMPITSGLFMIGSLSICGLPLFNGFISEFIIYFGLFYGIFTLPAPGIIFCSLGVLALALMGALALACFSKVYGTVFCGEPRAIISESGWPRLKNSADNLKEPEQPKAGFREATSKLMLVPMMVLAALCVWIGLFPQTVVHLAFLSGAYLIRADASTVNMEAVLNPLSIIIGTSFLFLAIALSLIVIRRLCLGSEVSPVRETWSCGFSQVSSRFQYTSSSFARLIVKFVSRALMVSRHGAQVTGAFPDRTHLSSSVHDAAEENIFQPLLSGLTGLSRKIDNSRSRYTQMYLMFIFFFLIFLLVWKLR
jgi:hydrogenase-4 component B